jgi:hypothetical protein
VVGRRLRGAWGAGQIIELVGGIYWAGDRVVAFQPVVEVQKAAAIRAERERREGGIRKEVPADRAAEVGAVGADDFGRSGTHEIILGPPEEVAKWCRRLGLWRKAARHRANCRRI